MDFDDLADSTVAKLEHVARLKDRMPALKVTLFAIPAKCSDATIAAAKALGDWVALAPHGHAHTLGECYSMTDDEIVEKIEWAASRGIDAPAFRAPRWILDLGVYEACKRLDYTVADHKDYRILGTSAKVYTYNKPLRDPAYTRVHGHLPNVSNNGIAEHFHEFVFPNATEFKFVHEVGASD